MKLCNTQADLMTELIVSSLQQIGPLKSLNFDTNIPNAHSTLLRALDILKLNILFFLSKIHFG